MTLKTDIQQVFGVEGYSDKFNTHVYATGNSKALFPREDNPPSLDILVAELTQIIIGGKAFSSLNSAYQSYLNGKAYASVTAGGEVTLSIDTLLGSAFTADTLLLYAYNNGGDLDFGLYSENNGDFTSLDPQTYYTLDAEIYAIAEITTTVAMTTISDSEILDVRKYNTGGDVALDTFASAKSFNENLGSWYNNADGIYVTGWWNTSGTLGVAKFDLTKKFCKDYYVSTTFRPKRVIETTNKLLLTGSLSGAVASTTINQIDKDDLSEIGTGRQFFSGGTAIRLTTGDAITIGGNIFLSTSSGAVSRNRIVKIDEDYNILSAINFSSNSALGSIMTTDGTYLYFGIDTGTVVQFFKFDQSLTLIASTTCAVASLFAFEWYNNKLCICDGTTLVLLDDDFSTAIKYTLQSDGFIETANGFIVYGNTTYYTFDNTFTATKVTIGPTVTSSRVRGRRNNNKSFIGADIPIDGVASGTVTEITDFPIGTFESEPELYQYATSATTLSSSAVVLGAVTWTVAVDATITSSNYSLPSKDDDVAFYQTINFFN